MTKDQEKRLRSLIQGDEKGLPWKGDVTALLAAHDQLLEDMREIEERTRPLGDMADQAVNVLARAALAHSR